MAFKGAIAEDQGKAFSVFLVHHSLLSETDCAERVLKRLSARFPHLPVGLLAKHPSGRTIVFAEPRLGTALANVILEKVDWLELEGRP